MPNGMKFVVELLLAGTMAHGLSAQEPLGPKATPATEGPASQAQKSEAEPQAEVSVQDTTTAFKLRVNLVQVPVVVRGDSGMPVDGLRKEDFQLYDDGKLQTISTFAIENDQSRKERTEAALKTQVNNEGHSAQLAGAAPERFIALMLDDQHLQTSDVAPLIKAADGFIDSMGAADRVGIFTTTGIDSGIHQRQRTIEKRVESHVPRASQLGFLRIGGFGYKRKPTRAWHPTAPDVTDGLIKRSARGRRGVHPPRASRAWKHGSAVG
jgi:hypothetical protein